MSPSEVPGTWADRGSVLRGPAFWDILALRRVLLMLGYVVLMLGEKVASLVDGNPVIRLAPVQDAAAIAALSSQLGYPALGEGVF